MYPINNVSGIIQQEQDFDGMHIIVLFLIKPSDCDVEFFYQKINYFHYRADKYCSLYQHILIDSDLKKSEVLF